MPSHLRQQQAFEPISVVSTQSHFPKLAIQKKPKMSITQTYYIAATARTKLGKEACRPDHDLRLLVGHANLLDSLMIELADAEREQEAWFNSTVKGVAKPEEPRHIQWADTIVEDPEDDDDASDTSDSDSESDFYEDEEMDIAASYRGHPTPISPVLITSTEVGEDEEEFEDDEYDEEHALIRTSSQQPPELVSDEDDSEEESTPPTPPQTTLQYDEKSTKSASLSRTEQASFLQEGFFIPERSNSPMIAAF